MVLRSLRQILKFDIYRWLLSLLLMILVPSHFLMLPVLQLRRRRKRYAAILAYLCIQRWLCLPVSDLIYAWPKVSQRILQVIKPVLVVSSSLALIWIVIFIRVKVLSLIFLSSPIVVASITLFAFVLANALLRSAEVSEADVLLLLVRRSPWWTSTLLIIVWMAGEVWGAILIHVGSSSMMVKDLLELGFLCVYCRLRSGRGQNMPTCGYTSREGGL